MSRFLWCSLFLVSVAGCALPEERAAVRPLPENGIPVSYAELLTRARKQATAATDSFYNDDWATLEDAAKSLEQTARFLAKATDVPEKHKDTLPVTAGKLGKQAAALTKAARDKDVKKTNDVLTEINLQVREMRLEK
jgi:hypothetical protein